MHHITSHTCALVETVSLLVGRVDGVAAGAVLALGHYSEGVGVLVAAARHLALPALPVGGVRVVGVAVVARCADLAAVVVGGGVGDITTLLRGSGGNGNGGGRCVDYGIAFCPPEAVSAPTLPCRPICMCACGVRVRAGAAAPTRAKRAGYPRQRI